ncbi:right-handed parallel beta-helix repeat-containing protein (plasmid) [Fusobacteria bacterium ZRK30]|nr:right-handed parallel beta-helix repeat-containing protein [Fusobacteria bacterium ZRK30]
MKDLHKLKIEGTLIESINKAGKLFRGSKDSHVEIILDESYYFLEKPIVINHLNGPGADGSLTIKGKKGTCIGSGVKVDRWEKVSGYRELPKEIILNKEQLDNIWIAPFPEGIQNIKSLFLNEKILHRGRSETLEARETECERLRSFNVAKEEDRKLLRQVPVPGDKIKNIRQSKDMEILFAAVPWQLSVLPVDKLDAEKGMVYTTEEGTVAAFLKPEQPSWLENLPEFIGKAGEWAADSLNKLIFYWPKSEEELNNIWAPKLKELIRVEGVTNYDGSEDTPVENVHFEGITFLHSERDTKDAATKARGLQHDWEFFDRGNALLRFRGAKNCSVRECRFTASGGTAIRGDLYIQGVVIEDNEIDYVGSMGILLCGYGPGTKDVNKRNIIKNNLIHHTGELYHHGHAIFLWQSGENIISHNTIHHVPRKAIGVAGIRLPLLELIDTTWDDSSLLIRWDEMDSATKGKGYKLTKMIEESIKASGDTDGEVTDSLRDELWKLYMPFLHGKNNIIEYNHVYQALTKLGDGAVINISGAGEGNVVKRNYVHHISTNKASGVLRTDDWQSGTTFQENVIYKSNIPAVVRKNMTHVINNYFIDVSVKQTVRFASYPNESKTSGALLVKNIYAETEGSMGLYKEGYRSPGMVTPNDVVSDYNIIYTPHNEKIGTELLSKNQNDGMDINSLSTDPFFKNLEAQDFTLDLSSPAYKLGIESIDVAEMGIMKKYPDHLKKFDYDEGVGNPEDYLRGKDGEDGYLFW